MQSATLVRLYSWLLISQKQAELAWQMAMHDHGIPPNKVLRYDAHTAQTPACMAVAQDPALLAQYSLFIYSPAVLSGLNYTGKVGGVYGVFVNPGMIATDAMQMLGRARAATSYTVHMQHGERDLETDPKEIYWRRLGNTKATDQAIGRQDAASPALRELAWVNARIRAADNTQRRDRLSYFVALAKQQGWRVQYPEDKASSRFANLRKARAERERTIALAATLQAEPLTRRQQQALRDSHADTTYTVYGRNRHAMQEASGMVLEAPTLHTMHRLLGTPTKRRQQRAFNNMRDRQAAVDADLDASDRHTPLGARQNYTYKQGLHLRLLFAYTGASSYHEAMRLGQQVWLTKGQVVKRLLPVLGADGDLYRQAHNRRPGRHSDCPFEETRYYLQAMGLKVEYRQRMDAGRRFYEYRLCPVHYKQRWALSLARERYEATQKLLINRNVPVPLQDLSNADFIANLPADIKAEVDARAPPQPDQAAQDYAEWERQAVDIPM